MQMIRALKVKIMAPSSSTIFVVEFLCEKIKESSVVVGPSNIFKSRMKRIKLQFANIF